MKGLEIQSTQEKLVITIDRSPVGVDFLAEFLNRVRLEQLLKKADSDEEILKTSKEIERKRDFNKFFAPETSPR